MKYLKKYNESNLDRTDLEDVRDLFQEYIDEYDLVDLDKLRRTSTDYQLSWHGCAYLLYLNNPSDVIRISLELSGRYEKNPKDVKLLSTIASKLKSSFTSRLKDMGYNTNIKYMHSIMGDMIGINFYISNHIKIMQ